MHVPTSVLVLQMRPDLGFPHFRAVFTLAELNINDPTRPADFQEPRLPYLAVVVILQPRKHVAGFADVYHTFTIL
jgi:hypothetical protein